MNQAHWFLIIAWAFYYFLHSFFASTQVKLFFTNRSKLYEKYYRFVFTLLSFLGLIGLLYYQYSFDSPPLFKKQLISWIVGIVLLVPGILIMMVTIKKYFYLLSGIQSLIKNRTESVLKIDGIHQWMRHPLYSGTILFVIGLLLIFPTLNNLVAVIALIIYTLVGIHFEERKLVQQFGNRYKEYQRKVPKLIPDFKLRA